MPVRRMLGPLLAVLVVGGAAAAYVIVGASDPVMAAPGDPPSEAGVQVQGVGTATGTPDVLRVTVGVETSGPTVDEALASANAAAHRVLDALRAAEVADGDVQTVNVQLYPRYDHNGAAITGYVAHQELAVTLRDLGVAGGTITAAVEAGGDAARLQGVSYALDDDTVLQAQAREQAFADARRRAEQYAVLAGRTLGDLVWVREQVHPSDPVPVAEADVAGGGTAVPIAPGSTEVTVTAEVRWSLR